MGRTNHSPSLSFLQPSPLFSHFIAGDNSEVLDTIKCFLQGQLDESNLYLWGEAGVGKSLLLRAAATHAAQYRIPTYCVFAIDDGVDRVPPPMQGLLIIDDIQNMSLESQMTVFDWYNRSYHSQKTKLLVAGESSPSGLNLLDDLKTRIAGGLVFCLRALSDEEKANALSKMAIRYGFRLPSEVISLLLSRLPRDMNSLAQALVALDHFFLCQQKPLTLRRVGTWLEAYEATLKAD